MPTQLNCGVAQLLSEICGMPIDSVKQRLGLSAERIKLCLHCGKPVKPGHSFHNKECRHEYHQIKLICPECGNIFTRPQSEILFKLNHPQSKNGKPVEHFFCSQKCLAIWAGKHYGFAAHPENCGSGSRAPKYDYDIVWRKHLETGFGAKKLSRLLNIPVSSISVILWKKRRGLT